VSRKRVWFGGVERERGERRKLEGGLFPSDGWAPLVWVMNKIYLCMVFEA